MERVPLRAPMLSDALENADEKSTNAGRDAGDDESTLTDPAAPLSLGGLPHNIHHWHHTIPFKGQ